MIDLLDSSPLHHIAVICRDERRARRFYVEQLGFRLLRETRRADRDDLKLDLRMGDCELELFIKPGAPARPTYPEACGLRHIAFRVASVSETVMALNARGICCEPIRTDELTGSPMTFFFDPDGLPIEIRE